MRRRYEKLGRFPDRYLVMGDAVCSFNPIYGQGMTVAAMEAMALRDRLRPGGPPSPREFFAEAARIIDTPGRSPSAATWTSPASRGPAP